MPKFAFLVNNDGYRKYTYSAAKEAGASVPRIDKEYKLFALHNAEPLNRLFELPFKRIWFKKVVDETRFEEDDEIYFVLYESFHMSYSRKLIKYYKKKYRNARFFFFFTNPVYEYNTMRLGKIVDLLDGVYSFNKDDCDKNGYIYMESDPFLLPQQTDYQPDTDLFFIGANKGRLSIMLDLYERMTSLGLVCDFWITDVPEDQQKYADVIHYNQKMSYEDVLCHDAKTRCIVEVLQDGKDYTSIRTLEALQYRKKLLTMSDSIKNKHFYDPRIIKVFHDASEISKDFIRSDIDNSVYESSDFFSFPYFEDFMVRSNAK